jgi:flagellar biogenesis protein FliO
MTLLVGALMLTPPAVAQPVPAPAAQASAPASTPALSNIPLRRDEPARSEGPSMLVVVAVLSVLVAIATFAMRRRGAQGLLRAWQQRSGVPTADITRMASQPLTAQTSIHVVRWNDEELLLGCTPQQVTLLARRPVHSAGDTPS